MKRAFLALGLLSLLAVPASAGGGLGLHAGWVDMSDADNDAGWGLLFQFGVSEHVDIQFRGTDFRSMNVEANGSNGLDSDYEFQATLVDLGFTYNFTKEGRRVTPYLGGGGTYYLLDPTPDSQRRTGDEYGWYGLAGLSLPIAARWNVYLEGMWRDAKMTIKGDDLGFGAPVDVGVNLNGPQVNLGLAFTW